MRKRASFGGDWTQDKLSRLDKYLPAYTRIFTKGRFAKRYQTVYVDAFASTGYREVSSAAQTSSLLFPELNEPEVRTFLEGSVRLALNVDPPFDDYLFIELNAHRYQELELLKEEFPQHAGHMRIVNAEANAFLRQWCTEMDWCRNRAVMFLDPFGMQVEWSLLEAISATKAIDLWLLCPLSMGPGRMLTRKGPPPEAWAATLTRFFGTEDWRKEFYSAPTAPGMFGDDPVEERDADYDRISQFFLRRLEGIFGDRVAKTAYPLRNSKNIPLYLLCFCAGSPTGADIALRIANHILRS